MDEINQPVLVTGAAGFIGSNLCDALLADGHQVIGLDSFTDYYDRKVKGANLADALASPRFRFIEADLLQADLPAIFKEVNLVYHLAGQPGVRGSWGQQFEVYARNNILATQRLLESSLEAGGVPVVYASSSSLYGNLPTMPLQEDMVPAPVSPYGVTKLAAEHLCGLYSAVHGLPTVSLRLFTVYGPRQRPDMAFQRFLTAQRVGQEITIYGDGTQTRDFTYVGDVVRAFRLAADLFHSGRDSADGRGRRFNIAGGSRASIREVLSLVAQITGQELHVRYLAHQPGDVRDTWADTAQARQHLGFQAQLSLEEGLTRQWQHIRSQVEAAPNPPCQPLPAEGEHRLPDQLP
ncbi:MAG: GDP-mannose 4,6-dehydratase [Chloroflexota bacterium]|nr:GDP-mannose 4,6-dehydratase [Chloroflexota bacterium]